MNNLLLDGTVIATAIYLVSFGAIVAKETYCYVCDYMKSLIVKN